MAEFTSEAFDKLFADHYEKLYRLCLVKTRNTHDSEQITLLVFEMLWENRHKLPDRPDWGGWLYKTTENKLHKYYRAKKKELQYLDEILHPDSDLEYEEPDESPALPEDIQKRKDALLAQLTPEERQLYDEIYQEKTKYKDIAAKLHTSEGAIKMRAKRLKKKLNRLVKEAKAE